MHLLLILALCGSGSELQTTPGFFGSSGDFLASTAPYATVAYSLGKGEGKKALIFSSAAIAAITTTYTLKHFIHRCRPDNSNNQSFPSGHTTLAFSSAIFLQRQYGSKIGIPALAVASYVGYTRIKTKRHHFTDVLVGAAISIGTDLLIHHK
jgi:membrane-associated phospholipid phosphatase